MEYSSHHPVNHCRPNDDFFKYSFNRPGPELSFISPESGKPLAALHVLCNLIRPQDPAIALAEQFGPEFEQKNPERDPAEMKNKQEENRRLTVGYQSMM